MKEGLQRPDYGAPAIVKSSSVKRRGVVARYGVARCGTGRRRLGLAWRARLGLAWRARLGLAWLGFAWSGVLGVA